MRILTVGDVVSTIGCEYLRQKLPGLKRSLGADIVIVNGENSAAGNGMLPTSAEHILDSGTDLITGGNHTLKRREVYTYLEESHPVIRPANFYGTAPGRGIAVIDKGRVQVGVINLLGTVFLDALANPFECVDKEVEALNQQGCRIILVDFHAEATGEKRAMGFYLDGRVSAMFGTHTHVQTSDAQVLPKGTGYITDLGMTGPIQSVLGIEPERAIEKTKTHLPVRFQNAGGDCALEGCVFDIDEKTGLCIHAHALRV